MSPQVQLPPYPQPPPKRGQRPPPGYKPPKKKRKKIKLPSGIRVFGPGGPRPNITGAGKKWKVGKAGGGKYQGWWVVKPMKPKVRGPEGSKKKNVPAGTPAPPPGPYDAYPEWARRDLELYDKDIARTQQFGGEVQKWLSSTLAPIQAASQAATQNYRTSIAGLPNAGNMAIPQVAGMAPGGYTQGSPEAWKTDAAQAQAAGYSTIQQGQGAIQSFLADTGLGNLRQTLEANFAGDVLRVPETLKKEKRQYLSNLNQFMMQQEAEAAAAKSEIAQRATNDWYDFVAQLTNAGVKLTDIQMDSLPDPTKTTGGVVVQSQTMPTTPGYQWYQESPGVWRGIKLPAAGGAGKGAKPTGLIGPIDPGTPVPAGYVRVKSGGKTYWRAKAGAAAGGGKGGLSPEQYRMYYSDARDLWRGSKATDPNTGETRFEAGINRSGVEGYTDAAGRPIPGRSGQYIRVVRVQRLDNELRGYVSSLKLRRRILRALVGERTFDEWNRWASSQKNLAVARRRGHI